MGDPRPWVVWRRSPDPPDAAGRSLEESLRCRNPSFSQGFLAQAEEVLELLGGQLGQPILAGPDDGAGDLALVLDHLVNLFLEGPHADVLVHLDVLFLADSEGPVCGLALDGRVPPSIEMKDMVGGGQIQAGPTGLEGQD